MDVARNTRAHSQSVFELSGQPYDPNDPELHTACSQTCRNFLADVSTTALEGVLVQLVRYLIRSKWFKDAMLWGCLCVAVDGTMCERKRGSALSDKEKRRYALEARIITPWGWNIPLLTEAVDAYDSEREKQDCEYRAFLRLAARLKELFPKQAFCIVGDALYCSRPIMDVCRANKWEFVLVFKEGAMPKVYKAVQSAKRRVGKFDWVKAKGQDGAERTVGVVSWVDARDCAYELGDGEDFRVVTYFTWERTEDAGAYSGAFATSFEVTDAKRALEVSAWGRRRWNIEGGFRVEKHGGFGLEHTFCNDDTAGRNYHVLMQIAYALWQVFDTGVLSRLSEGCRKPTQEMWAKLLFLALELCQGQLTCGSCASRRGWQVPHAASPPRGLNCDGKRRPVSHAVAPNPTCLMGGKGADCLWHDAAAYILTQTTFQTRGGWRRSRQATLIWNLCRPQIPVPNPAGKWYTVRNPERSP